VGKRPEKIEDGPARAAATLQHEAHNNRLLAEYERRQAEREATGPTETPSLSYVITAFTPPERLASIFDAAAGHAIREPGKSWCARWTCEACGYVNFSPPALRCQPNACWRCGEPPAVAGETTTT
jgi:hypothetical protein